MTHSFAVIPAAGVSRRMGQHKLLMPWGKATVIDHVLAAWTTSKITRTVIVVRRSDQALIDKCRNFRVDIVAPKDPPGDMKTSVCLGLAFIRQAAAPTDEDVWLLAPADMPRLQADTIDRLLHEHEPLNRSILVPRCKMGRGHPVLFPWPKAYELSTLGAHEGVNALLDRHPLRYIETVDSTICDDLDTPNDYRRLSRE